MSVTERSASAAAAQRMVVLPFLENILTEVSVAAVSKAAAALLASSKEKRKKFGGFGSKGRRFEYRNTCLPPRLGDHFWESGTKSRNVRQVLLLLHITGTAVATAACAVTASSPLLVS